MKRRNPVRQSRFEAKTQLSRAQHRNSSRPQKPRTAQLLETAIGSKSSVSAVQATHESKLPFYGCIGGSRVQGSDRLYEVETVIEKTTPTEAKQKPLPAAMGTLGRQLARGSADLSAVPSQA